MQCRLTASVFSIVLASLIATATALPAADWPTHRHDNAGRGAANQPLAAGLLTLRWQWQSAVAPHQAWDLPAKWDAYAEIRNLADMRDYDAAFGLVAAGGKVYFGSSVDDTVRCLDLKTGAVRWRYVADGPVRMAPTLASDRLFFGADDGRVRCLDPRNGKLIWSFAPPVTEPLILNNGRMISSHPCRSGVLVSDNTVYCAFSLFPWQTSFLCALDAQTGKPNGAGRFVREVGNATFEGGLFLSHERLVAMQGRVPPLVFQSHDGQQIRRLSDGGGSFGCFINADIFIHGPGNKTGWLVVTDLATKAKPKKLAGCINAAVARDAIYLLSHDRLAKTKQIGAAPTWTVPCPGAITVIATSDAVIVGQKGSVTAFRASNGHQLGSVAVDGRAHQLIITGECLLVSTTTGAVYCFATDHLEHGKSTVPQTTKTATPPASDKDVAADARHDQTARAKRASVRAALVRDASLIGRWRFHRGMFERARRMGRQDPDRYVPNEAGGNAGHILGTVQLRRVGGTEALALDGTSTSVRIANDLKGAGLPTQAITAEAWVRIDQPLRWGGIVGALQDNGNKEFGWVLGYEDSKFAFAVRGQQGNGRLTYLAAQHEFQLGHWYHVVGTYDGTVQSLYVNGRLENSAQVQRGPILYPPHAFFEIGAYHDRDEYYRTSGLLQEVSVYSKVLKPATIREHYANKKKLFPVPVTLAVGPWARYVSPNAVEIHWQTARPSATTLEYEFDGKVKRVRDNAPKQTHVATILGLVPDREYRYWIVFETPHGKGQTQSFTLDTHFNYTMPPIDQHRNPYPRDERSARYQRAVKHILRTAKMKRGVCLVVGCDDGQLAYQIARGSQLRVLGVDTDAHAIDSGRKKLLAAGVYGDRVALLHVDSYAKLPFVDRFANIVTSQRSLNDGLPSDCARELFRMTRPDGGMLIIGQKQGGALRFSTATLGLGRNNAGKLSVTTITDFMRWTTAHRGPLTGAGQWSHMYGRADNAAFGGEQLGGVANADGFRVQWFGLPGPRAQADRNGRKGSPLATNGRLFVQGLDRLTGLDAYNGTILWSLEVPSLGRYNMPRDCSNWCADDDHVYVAVRDRCWQIDAAHGDISRQYSARDALRPVPGKDSGSSFHYDWGYVACQSGVLLGSAVRAGTMYRSFWGKLGWYDARSGPETAKVCSDQLFGLDPETGKRLWTYAKGVVLNSTITAAAGRVYFVECRNAKILAFTSRRIETPDLWSDQYLVALDLHSGKLLWQTPLDLVRGSVAVYMMHARDRLLIATSADKHFVLYAFADKDGKQLWHSESAWFQNKGDHGKALSRPVVLAGRVYLRPSVFDLQSGKKLAITMPTGGCGTYVAAQTGLIFRHTNVTLWNPDSNHLSGWSRLRPGCWLSAIPACGMVLAPEAGGGCSCGNWMETSIGFMPETNRAAVQNREH